MRKTFFFRKNRSFSRNSNFEQKTLADLSKLHSTCAEESSAESCDLQKMCFRHFFRTSHRNILCGLSKTPSMSPQETREQWKISGNFQIVIQCLDFEQKMEEHRAKKNSEGLTETAVYLYRRPFWNVNHDYKKNAEFRMKKTRKLCKILPGVVESAFYISRNFLSGRTFFWKQLELSDRNRILSRKKSSLIETAFFVCKRLIWGNLSFAK